MANFRQQYISKLVGQEQEANLSDLSKLLDPGKDFDMAKIREFTWRFKIPTSHRREIWMILLNVVPHYRVNDEDMKKCREEEAQAIFDCLRHTGMLQSSSQFVRPWGKKPNFFPDDLPTGVNFKSSEEAPSSVDLAMMLLLAEGNISERSLIKLYHPYYYQVTDHVLFVCEQKNWRDAFHLSRGVIELMRKTYPNDEAVMNTILEIHNKLTRQIALNAALVERKIFGGFPIRHWLLGGGAGLISTPRALQWFWDKLLTGESTRILMQHLIVEFLVTIDRKFGDDLKAAYSYRLTEEGNIRIVKRALEEVQKTGGRKSTTEVKRRFISIPMRDFGALTAKEDINCTHGIQWIHNYFGDCVDNEIKLVGFAVGLVSLVLWMLPMVPQFLQNYKNKSCEGLTLAFLLSWIIGDTCNAVGAVLTDQQSIQQITGFIYVVQDILVATQYTYYTRIYQKLGPSRRRSTATLSCIAIASIGSYCLLGTTLARQESSVFRQERSVSRVLEATTATISAVSERRLGAPDWWPIFESYTDLAGYIIGCVASVIYCVGRIPQLIYNYKRKSCDGLSPAMFYITVAANFTYGLSVMLACTGWHYFWRHLPWIAGAVGWGFLDFLAIMQLFQYRKMAAEDHHRDRDSLLEHADDDE
ncbi:unnamed protein product, partial [Mesorhabditis spiculigera]